MATLSDPFLAKWDPQLLETKAFQGSKTRERFKTGPKPVPGGRFLAVAPGPDRAGPPPKSPGWGPEMCVSGRGGVSTRPRTPFRYLGTPTMSVRTDLENIFSELQKCIFRHPKSPQNALLAISRISRPLKIAKLENRQGSRRKSPPKGPGAIFYLFFE